MAQTKFYKLWAATAASHLSDGITLVAAPLLAASLTRDPALVAGLAFAQRVPWLLFALLSGALADRLDRRRAMAAAATCRAVLIGGLGLAVLMHVASLPLVYGVFFLVGTGETLFDISAATLLPAIVPPAELPRANARLAGTVTLATLLPDHHWVPSCSPPGPACRSCWGRPAWRPRRCWSWPCRARSRSTTCRACS